MLGRGRRGGREGEGRGTDPSVAGWGETGSCCEYSAVTQCSCRVLVLTKGELEEVYWGTEVSGE